MDALAAAHNAAVQMIDTSIVRVHQHATTRYDKLAANYLAFIQLASIRLWLRVYEFTSLLGAAHPSCGSSRKVTPPTRPLFASGRRPLMRGASGRLSVAGHRRRH
jgi:hypothetical protein